MNVSAELMEKAQQARENLASANVGGPHGFVAIVLDTHVVSCVFGFVPPFAIAMISEGETKAAGMSQQSDGSFNPYIAAAKALEAIIETPDIEVPREVVQAALDSYKINSLEELEDRQRASDVLGGLGELQELLSGRPGGRPGFSQPDAVEDPDGDPEQWMARAMGRAQARAGVEWPEERCPECENRTDCPILEAFNAEKLVIQAEAASKAVQADPSIVDPLITDPNEAGADSWTPCGDSDDLEEWTYEAEDDDDPDEDEIV